MRRKVAAPVIVFIALFAAGCSLLSHDAPNEDIDKAAALFFQRLDKGDYNGIYNDAGSKLRTNKTREIVTESLKELSAHGKIIGYDRVSMAIQGEGKGRMVLPVYRVSFEQVR